MGETEKAPRALSPAVRLRLTCMRGTVCIAPERAWMHNVDVCSTATGGKLEDGRLLSTAAGETGHATMQRLA